jgi:hypothetical protein
MKRSDINQFRDIPNVGLTIEKDFFALGLGKPTELIGKDPYQLFRDLCRITQKRHDPCVLDVFISAVRYMEGGPLKKWWEFTEERKKHLNVFQ